MTGVIENDDRQRGAATFLSPQLPAVAGEARGEGLLHHRTFAGLDRVEELGRVGVEDVAHAGVTALRKSLVWVLPTRVAG